MTHAYGSFWKHLLTEIKVSDGIDVYSLQIGYINIIDFSEILKKYEGQLYLRLWDKNEYLVKGSWVSTFEADTQYSPISPQLLQSCMSVAERVQKLKAFI